MILGQALIVLEEGQPSWADFNYLPPSVAQRVVDVINEWAGEDD